MRRAGSFARAYGVQAVVLIVLAATLSAVVPVFRGGPALFSVLDGLGFVGIATAGIAVVMIVGELDLSIGSMAALAGVASIRFSGLGLIPAILIATAIGVGLGAAQGLLIARMRISSLVVTVASLIVFEGAASVLAGGQPISLVDLSESDAVLVRIGSFTPPSLIGLVLIVLIGVMLARTRSGRELYAIGGARAEATAAGVSVNRSLVIAFATSGGCAALAGSFASIQGAAADPAGFGSLLLTAVAAALIGGVSLYGGRGDGINLILGVLILLVLNAGTSAAGAPSVVTDLLTGALLLVVIAFEFVLARVLRSRRLQVQRSRIAELETPPSG